MHILLVTEKNRPATSQRDGGARLVTSLLTALGDRADVMQFGLEKGTGSHSRWSFCYPVRSPNRFERRIANAAFVAAQVARVADNYAHIVFVHASMQFGFADHSPGRATTWTFPMFLTPSYRRGGEFVPGEYTELERRVLMRTNRIVTPSRFERDQIVATFGVPRERLTVIPRGIDRGALRPRTRVLDDSGPVLCSVGSIKPQKDTLRAVRLFARVAERHPGASLRLVGPVQDSSYGRLVANQVRDLGLPDSVRFVGPVSPGLISVAFEDAHMHLSAAACETFGRAQFEALASGLVAVAPRSGNAAAEQLAGAPYARFFDDDEHALHCVDELLGTLGERSELALEVGELFDDDVFAARLGAEIRGDDILAVADFDGTLLHKDSPERTRRSVEAFMAYPTRVLCSARGLPDLLRGASEIGVTADHAIAWSGAVVADASGRVEQVRGLGSVLEGRIRAAATVDEIRFANRLLQLTSETPLGLTLPLGAREETYQGRTFFSSWHSSKLRAVVGLLRRIQWTGRVRVFGDGPHDLELLACFDGTRIRSEPRADGAFREAREVTLVA